MEHTTIFFVTMYKFTQLNDKNNHTIMSNTRPLAITTAGCSQSTRWKRNLKYVSGEYIILEPNNYFITDSFIR